MKTLQRTFVYGTSVSGNNFTDRVQESRRLKMDFENGLNVVLISPRRMGKTSLVKHVQQEVDSEQIQTVYMDIYDCRSEYDFYNKFASELMKQTSGKMETVLENIKRFLVRLTPKISFGPEPASGYSFSLGISPKEYAPEEILQLPELLAQHIGKHIVVCIDEFQQVAEWPDSLQVQKRMRGIWQHQQHVSYCIFGSRQHMMNRIFQNRKMPFYQFGEPNYLQPIPTADWIPFIRQKFAQKGLSIAAEQVSIICDLVQNQSSYVQQLAWNVMLNTEKEVGEYEIEQGVNDLLAQCTPLFMEQTSSFTSCQMNFLKAIANGVHKEFTSKEILSLYNIGSKSNVQKLKTFMLDKDFVSETAEGIFLSDPVMLLWLQRKQ